MNKTQVSKYAAATLSAALGIGILMTTTKLDIPECTNSKVLSSTVALWKQQELLNHGKVEDGRLREPFEMPLKISNGRSCSAELLVNGQPTGSISYTVMRPINGAAGMVTLD